MPEMSPTIERILQLAQELQQIPAPSFDESQRAAFVRELFLKEQLQDVSIDGLNNVYGRHAGDGTFPPLVISAHLDTVFSRNVARPCVREQDRIYGPGIGDNSLGVAALVGLLWLLRERGLHLGGDLWFVANACEEGLGDLRGMRAVVERFRGDVRAYLVVEGTALGHVYHRAVGVRRYRVRIRTAGGHSWSDFGQPSAVHEAAGLVSRLTSLALPVSPRTTLNVGLMSGGTGVNVLAAEATFELDVRSEKVDSLTSTIAQVESMIKATHRDGVEVESEIIGQRPAGEISVAHPLVQLAGQCLAELGVSPTFTSGSTDANVPLSLGYPAVVLGVTNGGGAHTLHEYIELAPVQTGMEQLLRFVQRVLEPGTSVDPGWSISAR